MKKTPSKKSAPKAKAEKRSDGWHSKCVAKEKGHDQCECPRCAEARLVP